MKYLSLNTSSNEFEVVWDNEEVIPSGVVYHEIDESLLNGYDFVRYVYTWNGKTFEVKRRPLSDDALRQLRENECFPIINRGELWYDTLTDKQIVELKEWYQAWLDVTETKIIPQKPEWLYNQGE